MMPRIHANPSNTQRTPDQLNPWNPYFRTYGRVYPYGVASPYEEPSLLPNWTHLRTLYSSMGQPVSNGTDGSIPFSTYRSNLYAAASPHSSLVSRPRSSHCRARTPTQPAEHNLAAPVISIELSSDEDDLSSESIRALDGSDASSLSNHATRPMDLIARVRALNSFASTSARKTEKKPIFLGKPKHSSRADSVTSSDSIDATPLNFSNRLKRSHQPTAQTEAANKVFRIHNNRPTRRPFNEQQSDDSTDSSNVVEVKLNLNQIGERNAETAYIEPEQQSNAVQHLRNIKREVKNEPSNMSECSDDEQIETKGNLQSLLTSIKKE